MNTPKHDWLVQDKTGKWEVTVYQKGMNEVEVVGTYDFETAEAAELYAKTLTDSMEPDATGPRITGVKIHCWYYLED